MGTILFIGQAPSRITEGSAAFTGHSGRRIATLMGITHAEFLARFAAANLLEHYPGKSGRGDAFNRDEARRAAERLWPEFPQRTVFVGKAVAGAFGFADIEPCTWTKVGHRSIALLPHPSGVNHYWNNAANRERARSFLTGLVAGAGRRPARPRRHGSS
jgi:uracil-DNA glycosylase